MKNKQSAIEQFITLFSGQTFSDPKDVEQWMREEIPALVEDIYKEELKISDARWKAAEEQLRQYEDTCPHSDKCLKCCIKDDD